MPLTPTIPFHFFRPPLPAPPLSAILCLFVTLLICFQDGKLDAHSVLPLEQPLLELCQTLAAVTAPTREQRLQYDPELQRSDKAGTGGRPEPPSRKASGNGKNEGGSRPPRLQLSRKSSNCKLAPQTPHSDDGDGLRPLRAAPPPPSQVLLPGPPSTPMGGFPLPPPPSAAGPPGMGNDGGPPGMDDDAPPGAPPSFVSGESKSSVSNSSGGGGPHAGYAPPAVPARPSRNKSTPKSAKFTPTIEEDVVTLQNALAPIVPTILRILSEGNLMTTKNQTTLSLCLNTFAKPHWLRMFLGVPTAQGLDTKPKCANEPNARKAAGLENERNCPWYRS